MAATSINHVSVAARDLQASARFYRDELPDGAVQLYLRDPADNLVEVDWPDVTTLHRSIRARIVELADAVPQRGDARDATLYLDRRPA